MKKIQIINTIMCAVMILGAMAAEYMKPTIRMADQRVVKLEKIIPEKFGDWQLEPNLSVIEVLPELKATIDKIYSETLSRSYRNSKGQRVMLSLAYGKDQGDSNSVHRPEVCYPAQGFIITDKKTALMSIKDRQLEINKLVAEQGNRIEPIIYWTTMGDYLVANGKKAKLAQLSYGIRGIIPDGLLFRTSTIDFSAEKSYQDQQEFISALYMALNEDSKAILFGRSNFKY
jgi:EpsI family protein